MWSSPALASLLLAPVLLIADEGAPPPASKEPAALALLARAESWMGGRPSFEGLRYLRFQYEIRSGVVSKSRRIVLWDIRKERVRFEMETTRGTLVVLADMKAKTGVAFENGEAVAESDQLAVVNRAYGYALNDIRWLALPWLARSPNAELRLMAPLDRDGVVSERLEVKLDEDVYRLLIARETGEIRGWEWRPAALPEEQPALEFTWEEWKELEGVKWSTERSQVGGIQKIVFTELSSPRNVDEAVFEGL